MAGPGFAPDSETAFSPVVALAPPGPNRAARAVELLNRQLDFQRAIWFHPALDAPLEALVDQLPPRESTLIRASALYSDPSIPWQVPSARVHQISVSGAPRGSEYLYKLSRKYVPPESAEHMAGEFSLAPATATSDGAASVIGTLSGEMMSDTFPASAGVDLAAQALRQLHGDLKPPWDTKPGKFNHHDRAALARLHRDMPALAAKLDHYFIFYNVVDEFDSPDGPIVLLNLDVQVRRGALKKYPDLRDFYRQLAPIVTVQSDITDRAGHYWMRTRFAHGHLHVTLMDRDGMLTPFDDRDLPAGTSVELEKIAHGTYRTASSAVMSHLGMTFGLGNLAFKTDYRRDGDRLLAVSTMDTVPELIAPPGIHKVIDLLAGEFLRVMAHGDGGFRSIFSSGPVQSGLYAYSVNVMGEFEYSPTLEFLARIGDEMADKHNEQVRLEEREFGEELFDAFESDYNHARPSIIALDRGQAHPQ